MGKNGIELLRGTLGMLVLRTLENGPLHGYAVAKSIQSTTDETLTVEEGSLYPGALPYGETWLGCLGLGGYRHRAARQVLQPDFRGPRAARCRARDLG